MKELTRTGKLLVIALIILGYMFSGHTTQYLWLWFIVPIFTVSPITFIEALGLYVTIGWLTVGHIDVPEDPDKYMEAVLSISISRPLLSLFIGWLIHMAM